MKNIYFQCKNCERKISKEKVIGTLYRNHCPHCLYSIDIDLSPGDRNSKCKGVMMPIGLTFKKEGKDKYGKQRQGELMIIHECKKCKKFSINRIAGDDNSDSILQIFKNSQLLNLLKLKSLKDNGIKPLNENDRKEILRQLFGDLK